MYDSVDVQLLSAMSSYSDHQLRLAAKLYYVDGLSQTEVSKFVNVSQAHVSRLLAMAHKQGIVKIFVDEYEPRDSALENSLKEKYGLTAAAVVKCSRTMPTANLRMAVGRFAVHFVSSMIGEGTTVAISGGRTLQELITQLPPAVRNLKGVLQSMGNVDSNITGIDAQELGRLFAAHYRSPFHALSSPAFIMAKGDRDAFLRLDQIKGMRKRFDEVDVALVGIGSLEDSVFIERGVFARKDIQDLRKAGAVGEICGRFFDKNGRECSSVWKDRVVGIEVSQLRAIPNVVCIISGAERAAALDAAIRGGLVKSIAVDEILADALLQYL